MNEGNPHAAEYISPLEDDRVRRTIEAQLARRGMKTAPLGSADLAIAYGETRQQKVKSTVSADSQVYYRGTNGTYDYGGPGTYTDVYEEGTLTIQFFDPPHPSGRVVRLGIEAPVEEARAARGDREGGRTHPGEVSAAAIQRLTRARSEPSSCTCCSCCSSCCFPDSPPRP